MHCIGISVSLNALLVCNIPVKFVRRFLRSSRCRNPYDVLGLKSTCSTKDVKNAYIKLCKKLHPDMKPGDKSQHKKFIELNDAYSALMSTDNKKYSSDRGTNTDFARKAYSSNENTSQSWESEKAWYENEEYQEYVHRRNTKSSVRLENKISNLLILTGCFILVAIGSFLHFSAYSFAINYKMEKTDKKSQKISEDYNDVRKSALEKGKSEQLDNLRKKWSD